MCGSEWRRCVCENGADEVEEESKRTRERTRERERENERERERGAHTQDRHSHSLMSSSDEPATAGSSDFEISVTDPVKMGDSMQGFVTYRVSVRTRLPQYRAAEFYVIRRFSDFSSLHARLHGKNPGVIVPPLPEKSVVEKFRFTPQFIETRRAALKEYLDDVTAHPILKYSVDLQLFLEANEDEWKLEKSRVGGGALGQGGPSGTGKKMLRDISQGAAMVVGKEIRDDDPVYQNTKGYFATLESSMEEICKQVERYVTKQREQSACLGDFGRAMAASGEYEGAELGRKFATFNKFAEKAAAVLAEKIQLIADRVEKPAKKLLRSLDCVKAAMNDRENAFFEYRSLCQEVENKTQKKTKLSAQGAAQEQRVSQLTLDISETERKREAAKDSLDFVVERLNSELTRYQVARTEEMSTILANFAALQVEMSKDTSADWMLLLPELDGGNPVVSG